MSVGATAALTPVQENAIARSNAFLYATCQAFNGSAAPVSIALGGIVGSYLLAADKSLATAPVTGFNLGVALAAIPAAMLMRKIGRKHGFMIGSMIGIVGLAISAWAIIAHSFWLFAFGLMISGSSQGFAQQYRFAAADRGTADFKAKAISWVLVGGIAAAIIGPQTVIFAKDLLLPVPFAGAFLAATIWLAGSLVVLSFLAPSAPPNEQAVEASKPARPLGEIMRQPRFIVAVTCGTTAYALMSFVMTAAPLAMIGCGFSETQATLGIQWHVMAMFAPSFFTGKLIGRYGKERIVALGMIILVACAFVALAGLNLANFWIALVLLGIGWNFGFIGATAMLTDTYRPEEKAKTQGANDFILFGTVALASLMSGQILNAFGWDALNWIILPFVALALISLWWLARHRDDAVLPA